MKSSKFEDFEKTFLEIYADNFDKNGIFTFMEDVYESQNTHRNPLSGELKFDNDKILYDSYGNEDSKLERVYYFPKWEILIKFKGTRCSYEGEEWQDMIEVQEKTRTETYYE